MRVDPRAAVADRIYYGWVVVVACFLASVVVFGTTYAFGVFYDAFLEAFDAPRSMLALVFGLQSALIYVAGIGAGRLVERRGQRWVAAISGIVLVAGLVWTALARSYLELLAAFGIVAAVGMSGLYIVGYATLPSWFERRRGAATGFASAGLGVGLLVVPPGADLVIAARGWRTAMLAVAVAVAVLSIAIVSLLADRPEDVGTTRAHEFGRATAENDAEAAVEDNADAGVEGDAGDEVDAGVEGDAVAEGDVDAIAGSDGRGGLPDAHLRAVVTSRPFIFVLLGWLLIFTPLYAVLSHVVLHAADVGIGRSTGVLAFALIGVTTTVARVGIGLLSDRIGRATTFVACAALLGGSTVGIGVAGTTWTFLALITVFGAGYGGCGGLIGALTADLFGDRSLNTLFAVLSLAFAAAGLLAPSLAGAWFEVAGSYRLAFVVAGSLGIAGAGCVALGARSR